jgi:type II secretory pathway pseudopilin PulG
MKKENGFSLLETLITVMISALIFSAIGMAISRYSTTQAAALEANVLEERRSLAFDLIKSDLDEAGQNLLATNSLGSGWEAGDFLFSADYSVLIKSDGTTVTRVASSGSSVIGFKRRLIAGSGAISFLPNGNAVIALANANNTRSLELSGSTISIRENGYVVFVHSHTPGDAYRITQKSNDAGSYTLSYFRLQNGSQALLYKSLAQALAYPISASLGVSEQGKSVEQVTIYGEVLKDDDQLQVIPPLPFDKATGKRLTGFVEPRGKGLFIMRGNSDIDPSYLVASVAPSAFMTVSIGRSKFGAISKNAVIMLIDRRPDKPASLLAKVLNVSVSADTSVLSLQSLTSSSAPGFNKLYSPPEDLNHVFPTGSLVLTLKSPVLYTIDNRSLTLTYFESSNLRVSQTKTTVAYGVQSLEVAQLDNSGIPEYRISLSLLTEGDHNLASFTKAFNYTAPPQAHLRPSEWQKEVTASVINKGKLSPPDAEK